jgi:hypothetical protein
MVRVRALIVGKNYAPLVILGFYRGEYEELAENYIKTTVSHEGVGHWKNPIINLDMMEI